jgi:hypothetical protein
VTGAPSERLALDGRAVFLSPSFPSGERGQRVAPYDPEAIADAVAAIARAVLYAADGSSSAATRRSARWFFFAPPNLR